MRETKFNNNSRFKTLSDEDLFADEVEPLNSILSKFKYWLVYTYLHYYDHSLNPEKFSQLTIIPTGPETEIKYSRRDV